MDNLYNKFLEYLNQENKEQAVELMLKAFIKAENDVDIINLYKNVLQKSINDMTCNLADKKICIWKEHIRSSIIRTILECAYPHIVRIKNNLQRQYKGKVTVVCPDGEYHEIGARMVSDYFMLAGYSSIYVGASTPKSEFIYAINEIKPDVVALSITNYYNFISAERTIKEIRKNSLKNIKIIVGGTAFLNNPNAYKDIGADYLLNEYEEILAFSKEEN